MTLTLNDLPDINFVDTDVNQILNEMISGYEKAYFESTGTHKKLYPGDPLRIWLYAQALREFHLRALIDDSAKQNLLKYARKENLQHLGAFSRTTIFEPQKASTKMKFVLSQARPTDERIPAGTRVSPGNDIYFATNEDVKVIAGAQEVITEVTCLEDGVIGNGFTPGQINILVDPIPWVASVMNTETSQGGAEQEDEDSFRERIHLAPEGFSVAGPSGAYEYYARKYSPLIDDVKVTSPSDGIVDICVLLKNGELPNQTFIDGLQEYLSAKDKRPLTDKVEASIPSIINYDLNVTYYIQSSDIAQEELIKERVKQAVGDYEVWQRSKIGRDINPDELNFRIRQAGAKRAVITSPIFTAIGPRELATVSVKTVNYGGLEDE